ncbi:chromate resistance protein ChrB domain-containing protein [Cochlodiniinecator piscidefendens]|uniref:chromate resistance protein ChrB domain-containing protein n=1 Tax=Cochlodiniinecator piscidefendens TaxID=2715756 RepID=UPI00140C80DD|nr:sulfurtransferase/chromate resistance protein [Cochlodiniinecator piscidefendens]
MASPNTITPAQLTRLIGTPDAPMLIDICIDDDFKADPRVIPTALRHSFATITDLAPALSGKRAVVICQKGRKLSQGAAALLRTKGIQAEYLEGGNFAWRDAGLPLIPADKIPTHPHHGTTLWVTRHRPKIDRIACPWLIRRFVDPNAQFLFVSPSEVMNVADRFGATPFDVEGVFWSHRGDTCTFDTMVDEFALDIPALKHLATIVRGADTNRHDLAPECAGLLAASLGLSRMYRDDLEQLDAGLSLYDAFYRWSRDATNESHDWPTSQNQKA